MKKRVAVAILWFYSTWVAWAFVAQVTGLTELAGPVIGAALAGFIAGDPMHRIWLHPTERRQVTVAAAHGQAA